MRWFGDILADLVAGCVVTGAGSVGRLIPRGLFPFCFERLGGAAAYFSRAFHQRSAANLGVAFGDHLEPEEIERIVRASLRNFFRGLGELVQVLSASPGEVRDAIEVQGQEHLDEARARGKGVIVLSAHLANFFLLGVRLAVEGYPTSVLLRPENRVVRRILDRYRFKLGQKVIYSRRREGALQELIRVLRQNELAMVIADEYRSSGGIPVPFFGRTVIARRGPVSLALRTGAAIVPAYVVRVPPSRLALIVEPEIELVKTGRVAEDIEENTRRITRWLEAVVRAYPEQWNWMNIRWQRSTCAH